MSFVVDEKSEGKKKVIFRFLWDLKLTRILFIPSFLLTLAAGLMPQVFLWELSKTFQPVSSGKEEFLASLVLLFDFSMPTESVLFFLILITAMLRFFSLIGIEIGGQWSTQKIHKKLIFALSKTRTTFFDENPSGRIINRVVNDYSNLRNHGIMFLADTQYAVAEMLCSILIVALINPWPAIFVMPILFVYFKFQSNLAPMIGHSHQLRSVLQGELLHRESDLIYGQNTYSFYKRQNYLLLAIEKIYRKILNQEIFHSRLSGWGFFWMGAASLAFTSTVYFFILLGIQNKSLEISLAAVVLSVLFTLEGSLSWVAMTLNNLSSAKAYVQRAYEYVDLPSEEQQEGIQNRNLKTLPDFAGGDIEFSHYSMSYRPDGPLIFKDLSMKIKNREHVGIIGRTGSGKSSWLQSLLRMVHYRGGEIKINNESIFNFDIEDYRNLFAVIPQDPYLFSGTVRTNLLGGDSFDQDEILNHLITELGVSFSLDSKVFVGGTNLSVGERQIICFIRGIVQKKSFFLFDEPTGSLDEKTDNQIRKIIAEKLRGKTVIMIAHRLESLQNFDKIFQFESGVLLRSGPPSEILN